MKTIWPDIGEFRKEDMIYIQSGLNLIQQGISIFDEDLKLVICNKRFKEIYDIPEKLTKQGCTFEEVVRYLAGQGEYGEGDIDQIVADRVNRARMFEAHYLERSRPNGTTIAIEGHPLKDGGWVAVYTDVTAQKQHEELLKERSEVLSERLVEHSEDLAETNRELRASNRALEEVKSALQASEERLQIINKSVPAHIAYLDENLIYRFSNQRSSEIWGLAEEEDDIVGKHIKDVYPPEIYEFLQPLLITALSGEVMSAEYTSQAENEHTARVVFTPEKSADGRVTGLFVLSIDVTDQKKVENSILKTQRLEAVTRLTGGLAHDLNNILTILLGNLSRLRDELSEEEQEDAVNMVLSTKKAARQAARIMECLVAFSRRRTLEPRVTDITRVLRDIYNLALPNVTAQISLSLDVPDTPMTCFIDESAFQDAVINLLFNANDALGGEGKIDVIASKNKSGDFVVTIADDGSGFDEEMLDKAFEPFATTKDRGAGSGLGLSMVQGFVLQSGGDVWIDSVPGKGSKVHMHFPAMTGPVKSLQEDEDDSVVDIELRDDLGPLLLVEDEDDIRAYLRHVLTNAGFKVIESSNAREALDLVSAVSDISMIISDINMPGDMNGLDFARQARMLRPELATILLSGLAETDQVWKEATDEFITLRKPFKRLNLIKAIMQNLKEKEPA